MMKIYSHKKIGFCITCMNRLHHLKKTLIKNIEDNYLPKDVEFVLLDYNSSDGLDEWVKQNLREYIDIGILNYYKTVTPKSYLRSHSRNMAIRLSTSKLVCNLDADNYLGKGFAEFMLNEFSDNNKIFYTSNFSSRDVIGRVCMNKNDFIGIRGYNEDLIGYGCEDVELFDRLIKNGLEQHFFYRNDFYIALNHPNEERISQEYMSKTIYKIYLNYINPYSTQILIMHNDLHFEIGEIIDNNHLNHNIIDESSILNDRFMDERFRITIKDEWGMGTWLETENELRFNFKNKCKMFIKTESGLRSNQLLFYEITDTELLSKLIMIISEALNFKKIKELSNKNIFINKNGFGKGFVYKNFNYENKIILQEI